ncbi:type I-F CRISPR-associated endonuclease Cas1f [Hahella aquimaris]|uniref:type I-F CRISPR-associated endonuclease Cas1f n=1 Tax=Hahella sp. HNIBRBA332 TaxID=3015983 RepID=UPI00273AFB84|nr:type I-F CRISPR-associated endonuclease Cas1f [Hahella sp. HNIBRBA332]WLQ14264.1 type I-F CRISPR-associated endonuclease Cas1f [Hahella sp. HNIBRBA332]
MKTSDNNQLKKVRPRAVMLSKRANVFYLERARVMQVDDRVVYLTETGAEIESMFNIPDKNTAFLLLGKGTSITDAAIRKFAESNVLVGFCGSGGSPLFGALDITFLAPQDEYRPTQYMQGWMSQWLNEAQRLALAKEFLMARVNWTLEQWDARGLVAPDSLIDRFERGIRQAQDTPHLLAAEAMWAKDLYKLLARQFKLEFRREEGKRSKETIADGVNGFLDHGNYIAYGYAATALHGLGIPFALPVLHGKTRRGALVFDVADIIKDGLVMPLAFEYGSKRSKDNVFRADLIQTAQEKGVLDFLMGFLSEVAVKTKLSQ